MPTQPIPSKTVAIAGDYRNPLLLTEDGDVYVKVRGNTPDKYVFAKLALVEEAPDDEPDKYVFAKLALVEEAPDDEPESETAEEITDNITDSNSEPGENSDADDENGGVDSQIRDSDPD